MPKLGRKVRYFLEWRLIRKSGMFDAAYYLSHNKDVAASGMQPLKHFLTYGAVERRDPSSKFNINYYLNENADVFNTGLNPLYHYLKYGIKEGRNPIPIYESLSSSVLDFCESSVLIFDHGYGGGATKYLYESVINTDSSITRTVLVRYNYFKRTYFLEVRKHTEIIGKSSYADWDSFIEDLGQIKFAGVIVNNLFSWPSVKNVLSWLEWYKQHNSAVRVEFKVHDYYCICPSFTLQDINHRFCGIRSDETGCNDCVKLLGNKHCYIDEDNYEKYSVSNWRDIWYTFFKNSADVLEVFSPSSKKIISSVYPDISEKIRLVPHLIKSFACCNVAVLGYLYIPKGAEIVRSFCEYLDKNCIDDMQLYLFGQNPDNIDSPHMTEMGGYERRELPDKLKKAKINMVLIPSTCPETFCYTAGESIALGYPTACFDLGGQADQVRAYDNGIILYSDKPEYLYTTLKNVWSANTESGEMVDTVESGTKVRTVVLQDKDSRDFLKWVYQLRDDKSHFVDEATDSINTFCSVPKVVATYLPQFHEFDENTQWFGRGFSEWTNTTKTLPQFIGHRQPHIPIDVGYYNLNNTDIMYRQVELARKYGVYGFCVYYYWFSGKKLMDRPLKNIINDKNLDFPFFLFWANDDWSMAWGNGDFRETLYKGGMNPDEAAMFMDDVLPYMNDSRYIKIRNKPILLIYKIALTPKEEYLSFVRIIQQIAVNNGFDGLYLISPIEDFMDHDNLKKIQEEYLLDALVEFHPIAGRIGWNQKTEKFMDQACQSTCYDVGDFVNNKKYLLDTNANVFPGLFPDWDNSPRRYNRGAWILQNTPENYKTWLSDLIKWTREHNNPEEQFIFVNAWNEWAEGAHLEPDSYYGYAYLQKTREALEESCRDL